MFEPELSKEPPSEEGSAPDPSPGQEGFPSNLRALWEKLCAVREEIRTCREELLAVQEVSEPPDPTDPLWLPAAEEPPPPAEPSPSGERVPSPTARQ